MKPNKIKEKFKQDEQTQEAILCKLYCVKDDKLNIVSQWRYVSWERVGLQAPGPLTFPLNLWQCYKPYIKSKNAWHLPSLALCYFFFQKLHTLLVLRKTKQEKNTVIKQGHSKHLMVEIHMFHWGHLTALFIWCWRYLKKTYKEQNTAIEPRWSKYLKLLFISLSKSIKHCLPKTVIVVQIPSVLFFNFLHFLYYIEV